MTQDDQPKDAGFRCPDCGGPVYTRSYRVPPSAPAVAPSWETEWYCLTPGCTFYDVQPANMTG